MAKKKETLLLIEKEDIAEAEFMSRNFVQQEVKNRAYINALGAELIKKYLSQNGIESGDSKNLHSVSKILEKYDIADILLPNMHIDVRVIFDESKIFIPKSHFENELTPDLYAVVKYDEKFKAFEFLGFIKPSQIDKKRANSEYYFVEKAELSPVKDFIDTVKSYDSKLRDDITEEEMLTGRELAIALNDHNISAKDEKRLLKLLLKSESLRESVLEFDNFETLAYSASSFVSKLSEQEVSTEMPVEEALIVEEKVTEAKDDFDEMNEFEQAEQMLGEDDFLGDEQKPASEKDEELQIDDSVNEDLSIVDESELMLEDNVTAPDEDLNEKSAAEASVEEKTPEIEENIKLPEEPVMAKNTELTNPSAGKELSVDDILDRTINSIDEPDKNQKSDIANKIISGIVTAAEATAAAGGLAAASQAASAIAGVEGAAAIANNIEGKELKQDSEEKTDSETENSAEKAPESYIAEEYLPPQRDLNDGAAASADAIKLTSVSGDLVEDVINENLEKQSKNLDRIDYKKTDIAPDVKEIPTNMTITDNFAASQIIQNAETEASGKFESPKDIDSMNKVKEYKDDTVFVQETVDMNAMETVKSDFYVEGNADGTYDMENLTSLSPAITPEEKFLEIHIQSEAEVVDLPDMESSFTIDADGNSNIDEMAVNNGYDPTLGDENLVDMGFEPSNDYPSSVNVEDEIDFDNQISEEDYVLSADEDLEKQSKEIIDVPESDTYTISEEDTYDENDLSDLLDEFEISDENSSEQENPAKEDVLPETEAEPEPETETETPSAIEAETAAQDMPQEDLVQDVISETELPEAIDENLTLDELPEINMSEELAEPEQLPEAEQIPEPVQDSLDISQEPDLSGENILSEDINLTLDEISENPLPEADIQMSEDVVQTPVTEREPAAEDEIALTDEILQQDDLTQEEPSDEKSAEADLTEEFISAEAFMDDTAENAAEVSPSDNAEAVADVVSADEFMQDEVFESLEELAEESPQTSDISGAADNSVQEWLEDDASAQNPEAAQQQVTETDIVEPQAETAFNVVENSVVISDKTFKAGEIRIDINNQPQFADGEPLSELYNGGSQNSAGREMLNNPGTTGTVRQNHGGLGKFLGAVVVLAIFGVVGFGAAKFFKNPVEETPNPVTDEAVPSSQVADNGNTPNVNPDNVVAMDNNTDALVKKPTASEQTASPAPSAATTPIIEIKKLTWEVPDYVSYNQDFKQYFQSAGRSLKAAISSDLLLATDNLYQNQLKVSVTFAKDGTFKNAQIITSCGSNQIDGIVLQTVNQTLKALKAPNSVNNDESTTAILKLYF